MAHFRQAKAETGFTYAERRQKSRAITNLMGYFVLQIWLKLLEIELACLF